MKLNKKVLIFISTVFLFSNLNAKDVVLEELIDIAIQNNSDIKIGKYKENIKDSNYKNSKANYLPKVSSKVELANYEITSMGNRVDDNVTGISLTVNQLIYDFGKTSNSIDSAKEEYFASNFETAKNISSTVLKTKQVYYDILSNFQRIELAKESIKMDELHLEQAEKYYNAGVRTLIDVTDAKLKLSNSKLELIQAQYSLKNSKTKLISVLGVEDINKIEIKNEKDIILLAKNLKNNDANLDNLLNSGYENRAELKMYEKLINSQNLKIKSVNAEYYPRLDFDAGYSDKNSDEIQSIDTRQVTAGIYLKWDIYTGNSTDANKKSAVSNLGILKQQLTQHRLQIKEEVTNAYFDLKQNEENINISLLSVDLSSQKLNLANQRYKAGLNDLVEINEARLQYIQAKNKLINSYYDYLLSKANIDFAVGVIY